MNFHEQETTQPANLRSLRKEKKLNQAELGQYIGLSAQQVSQIENGIRQLSPSEKAILDLYFFGIMPKGIVRQAENLRGVLDFSEDEWRVIQVLAKRAGMPTEKWIAAKVREYLNWDSEARGIRAGLAEPEKKSA